MIQIEKTGGTFGNGDDPFALLTVREILEALLDHMPAGYLDSTDSFQLETKAMPGNDRNGDPLAQRALVAWKFTQEVTYHEENKEEAGV